MPKCRLCGTQSRDILKHLAIVHELETAEQYEAAIQAHEVEDSKVKAFSDLVAELKKKRAEGVISPEEYRAEISNSHEG